MPKRKAIYLAAQHVEPGLRRELVAEAKRAGIDISRYILGTLANLGPSGRAENYASRARAAVNGEAEL